jgi:hypothetical protein
MVNLRDYRGVEIRLTDERLAHMRDVHPEIVANERFIAETVAAPEIVVQSEMDRAARLYYRRYRVTGIGEKHMCVLVKATGESPFVLTAYFTDRIKRGEVLWQRE